jgi:hypothetical protein
METYNLPTGEQTNDVDIYINQWRSLAAFVGFVTGTERHSYDPGLTMSMNGRVVLSIEIDTVFNLCEFILGISGGNFSKKRIIEMIKKLDFSV